MPLNIEFEPTRRHFLSTAAGVGAAAVVLPATSPASASGTLTPNPPGDQWPIAEPYPPLNGGRFSGPRVRASNDPLVRYQWTNPKASDGLQVYQLRPVAVDADQPSSFTQLGSAATPNCDITVVGTGSIRFDFGVESPAWLEFDSPDFSGAVEMSISEYNQPAVVNPGPANPVKTLAPQRYGDTFRLELNAELYEGVRFGWIHVRAFDQPRHITAVRAVCQAKPTNYNGRFACSDPLLTRIWYTGAYVVRAAFQQDFMGAILMDRGDRHSWAGDCNPIQAAAMVAFGNWDFVKTNLERTADANQGIEVYSIFWVLSLLEYYQHTGDAATLMSYISNVQGKLDHGNSIYANPVNTFYGWDERLGAGFEAPNRPETMSIYRSLLIQACREFADAMHTVGRDDVGATYQAIAEQRTAELHADPQWFAPLGVHARAHAVNAGFVEQGEQQAIVDGEFTDRLNRLSFSPFNQYFILQAMTALNRCDDAMVTVRDNWGGQLQYGGTTFFEVFRPDWLRFLGENDPVPNSQSGWTSLAHPWGGGVTAWLSHDILGIKPTSPGYDTVDVFPRPGRTLTWVSGSVPTPHGPVSAKFDIEPGRGEVHIPVGARGRIGIPGDGRAIKRVQVNRKLVWDGGFHQVPGIGGAVAADGTVILTDVAPGRYGLDVSYGGTRGAFRAGSMSYPMRFLRTDTRTSGDWGGVYGRDGYILFNYDGPGADRAAKPPYVESVVPWVGGFWSDCLSTVWQSGTDDRRAPASDSTNGIPRSAACLYTGTPSPGGMTMPIDVTVAPGVKFQLAMYFVDWDSVTRELAVEIFDLESRKLVAPEQMIKDFHAGTYLVYECDRSVRIRVAQILGANAVLSGLFFDPLGND
jgi:alpha-L-rhamnosidase